MFGKLTTHRIVLVLAAAAAPAVLVVWLVWREADRQELAASQAARARQLLATLDGLSADLRDAQTRRCAYVTRVEPAQKEEFEASASSARQKLQQLQEMTSGDGLADLVRGAAGLAMKNLSLLEDSLRLRERNRFNDRGQLALTSEVQSVAGKLEQVLANLRAEADRALDKQTQEAQSAAQKSGTAAGFGGLLTVLLVGTSVVGVTRELTARERDGASAREQAAARSAQLAEAHRALDDLKEQLRQAQALASLGRLTGGVAHDFNNLLTVMIACSEASLQSLPSADPSREFITQVIKAARKAAELTKRLVAASRGGAPTPSAVDLNALLADLEPLLKRLAGGEVEMVTAAEHGLSPVWADRALLDQVLLNLVANARDAMKDGGTLRLQTRCDGREAILTVTDTGCGMSDEVKARLFEPFFTTKGPGQGTGLGMAIVLDAVRQCGGRVEVDSEVGRGTTVRVYLPLAGGLDGRATPA